MKIDPAEYWSQINQNGSIERWGRRARRKMAIWNLAILFARTLKRGLDIVGSLGALIAFSPIFLITALLIKLEDRGPIFFCQKRVGTGGRHFGMWKFRSMIVNADQIKDQLLTENQHGQSGVTFKMKDDPRITKIGKWNPKTPKPHIIDKYIK
jgi:lipopolysaccharide/colanic/teichoic acid biosynthesis glycosyltransferase